MERHITDWNSLREMIKAAGVLGLQVSVRWAPYRTVYGHCVKTQEKNCISIGKDEWKVESLESRNNKFVLTVNFHDGDELIRANVECCPNILTLKGN